MKFGEEEVEIKDYVPDSLNMRVVGMWPFGQGQAIEGLSDTVYVSFFSSYLILPFCLTFWGYMKFGFAEFERRCVAP